MPKKPQQPEPDWWQSNDDAGGGWFAGVSQSYADVRALTRKATPTAAERAAASAAIATHWAEDWGPRIDEWASQQISPPRPQPPPLPNRITPPPLPPDLAASAAQDAGSLIQSEAKQLPWLQRVAAGASKENALLGAVMGGGSVPGMIGGAVGGAFGGAVGAVVGATAGQAVGALGGVVAQEWTNYSKADISSYLPGGGRESVIDNNSDKILSLLSSMSTNMKRVAEVGVTTTSARPSKL